MGWDFFGRTPLDHLPRILQTADHYFLPVPAVVIGKWRGGKVYDDAVAFLGVPSGRDLVEKLTGTAGLRTRACTPERP